MLDRTKFQEWVSELGASATIAWSASDENIWLAIQRHGEGLVINYKCLSASLLVPIKRLRIAFLNVGGGKANILFHDRQSYSASGTEGADHLGLQHDSFCYDSDKVVINVRPIAASNISLRIEGEGARGKRWSHRVILRQASA